MWILNQANLTWNCEAQWTLPILVFCAHYFTFVSKLYDFIIHLPIFTLQQCSHQWFNQLLWKNNRDAGPRYHICCPSQHQGLTMKVSHTLSSSYMSSTKTIPSVGLQYITSKLCASFHNHQWQQTPVTVWKCPIWVKIGNFWSCATLKFDGWPWKTIWPIFFATSSFVHHSVAICECKLELQSRNGQIGAKIVLTCDLDLWPWPLAWTSCLSMVITPENFRMIRWQEHCEKGVMDKWTDRQKCSLSCLVAAKNMTLHNMGIICGEFQVNWQNMVKDMGKTMNLGCSSNTGINFNIPNTSTQD